MISIAAVSPTASLAGVAVAGAAGRMGRVLIQTLQQHVDLQLQGALVASGSPLLGADAGLLVGLSPLGLFLTDQLSVALASAEVLIDFSTPSATMEHLAYCCQHGKAMVIGTTGFDAAAKRAIVMAATKIAIVWSANFSVGINVIYRLLATATKLMGHQSDIDICERHHRHKVDAPSGSALAMGEVIANALGRSLPQCTYAVQPRPHTQRELAHIGFTSIRAGEIIGEHSVTFTTGEEQLAITHSVSSRLAFASGALRAAHWLLQKPAALYDLQDVLGL